MEQEKMLEAIETAVKAARETWDDSRKKEVEALELKIKDIQEGKELSEKELKDLQKHLNELDVKLQGVSKNGNKELNSFQDVFAKAIDDNEKELSELSGIKGGGRSKVDKTINLLEGLDRKEIDFDNFSTGLYDKLTTSRLLPGI